MSVLWRVGDSAVSAVRQELGSDFAYTTVQTVLNILERKGHVRRSKLAKAHIYSPLTNQRKAQCIALKQIAEALFNGSYKRLAALAEAADVTAP